VVFLLPWQGAVIAGTTDVPCALSVAPEATASEVAFILDALRDYLNIQVLQAACNVNRSREDEAYLRHRL